jgi:hypothetical protein
MMKLKKPTSLIQLAASAVVAALLFCIPVFAQRQLTSSPVLSTKPFLEPTSSPLSDEDKQELERLRQEKQIRDRIEEQVNNSLGNNYSLMGIVLTGIGLLLSLVVGVALGIWLLRKGVIATLAEEVNRELAENRDANENTILEARKILAEIKEQPDVLEQRVENQFAAASAQINHLVTDNQKLLEEIRQQITNIPQSLDVSLVEVTAKTQVMLEEIKQQSSIAEQQVKKQTLTATSQINQMIADTQNLLEELKQQRVIVPQFLNSSLAEMTAQVQNMLEGIRQQSSAAEQQVKERTLSATIQMKDLLAEAEKVLKELKQQITIGQEDINILTSKNHVHVIIAEAQEQKDRLIQELTAITPSPILTPDAIAPETKQKIQQLVAELESLESSQIVFTATDRKSVV